MLAALLDIDAFAWQADWYRSRVREMTGAGFQDSFALWLVDNAHHENPRTPLSRAHAVSYGGALQQALRDLSRWVETGVRPAETRYQISNTQVVVPASAEERMGIQPVATLTANGAERTSVAVGEAVTLSAHIEVPPGAGKVVALEWDFEGRGDFTVMKDLPSTDARMALSVPHAYSRPGTRFAGLRVTSQRQGDGSSRYGRIQNIARTRIDVT
jgi:hypothetical protein